MIEEKERLIQFVESQGISNRKFSEKCGLSSSFLSSESSIQVDKLKKVFTTFPELNMDWVVTGRGEMLYAEKQQEATSKRLNEMKDQVAELQAKLIKCYEEKDFLNKAQRIVPLPEPELKEPAR